MATEGFDGFTGPAACRYFMLFQCQSRQVQERWKLQYDKFDKHRSLAEPALKQAVRSTLN